MKKAYLGLGSNLGDRLANIKKSLALLLNTPDIDLIACSPIYETAPVGGPEQDYFLNACISINTGLSPTVLLEKMLAIEKSLKRIRRERWGPRTVDLDLLLYESITMNTPLLELPHPRLAERDFVLVPLADIAPLLHIPGKEKTVKEILGERENSPAVTLYCWSDWCSVIND